MITSYPPFPQWLLCADIEDTLVLWKLSNEAVCGLPYPAIKSLLTKLAPGKQTLASGPGRCFPLNEMTRSPGENILPLCPPGMVAGRVVALSQHWGKKPLEVCTVAYLRDRKNIFISTIPFQIKRKKLTALLRQCLKLTLHCIEVQGEIN